MSWRWLFILGSIPVGISILLVHRFVPESPIRTPSRVDVPGALLFSAALVALMIALTEGAAWGWTSARVLGLGAASLALFVWWAIAELRSPSPMVDMRMLAHRPVMLTNVATMVAGFALFSCFVLVPTFVESAPGHSYGFGASATKAGLYLLPSSLAMLFAGPAAGLIGRRFGSKWPLAGGMVIVGLSAIFLAEAHDRPWHVVAATGLLGLGVGLAFAAMAALITENVSDTETGVATGVNTVMRMIGAVVGGQLGAALLTSETIRGTSFPAESAYTTAFALSAVAALAAALIALSIGARPLRRLGPVEAVD